MAAQAPTINDIFPKIISSDDYEKYLGRVQSLPDLRRLHWELGASELDTRACSRAALQRLVDLNVSKEDLITFYNDLSLGQCFGPDIECLCNAFPSFTVSERLAILHPRLLYLSQADLSAEFFGLCWSKSAISNLQRISQRIEEAHATLRGLYRLSHSADARTMIERLQVAFFDKLFGDIFILFGDRFQQEADAGADAAFELLGQTFDSEHVIQHLISDHGALLYKIVRRDKARCLPALPKTLASWFVTRTISNRIVPSTTKGASLEALWYKCFQRSASEGPLHTCLSSIWPNIFSMLSAHFQASDAHFLLAELPVEAACRFVWQYWMAADLVQQADKSRSIRAFYYPKLTPTLWKALQRSSMYSTSLPHRMQMQRDQDYLLPIEQRAEFRPILEGVEIMTKYADPDSAIAIATDSCLQSLREQKQYAAFAWYGRLLKQHYWIVLPYELVRDTMREASPTHPRAALDIFWLHRKSDIEDVPDLVHNLLDSKGDSIHPKKVMSPLERINNGRRVARVDRPARGYGSNCALTREKVEVVSTLAWRVALEPRFTAVTALRLMGRIWMILRSHGAPTDWRISQSMVIAAVGRFFASGRCSSKPQVLLALRTVSNIDGQRIADQLDVAIWQARQNFRGFLAAYIKILEDAGQPQEQLVLLRHLQERGPAAWELPYERAREVWQQCLFEDAAAAADACTP